MVSYYFPTLESHLPLAPQGKADGTGGALHTNAKARLFIIDILGWGGGGGGALILFIDSSDKY